VPVQVPTEGYHITITVIYLPALRYAKPIASFQDDRFREESNAQIDRWIALRNEWAMVM